MRKQSAYMFFKANAGYSHGPAETPEQGRRRCARLLASAEKDARDAGYSFDWSIDSDVLSSDWIADGEDGGADCDPWQTWCCVLRELLAIGIRRGWTLRHSAQVE